MNITKNTFLVGDRVSVKNHSVEYDGCIGRVIGYIEMYDKTFVKVELDDSELEGDEIETGVVDNFKGHELDNETVKTYAELIGRGITYLSRIKDRSHKVSVKAGSKDVGQPLNRSYKQWFYTVSYSNEFGNEIFSYSQNVNTKEDAMKMEDNFA